MPTTLKSPQSLLEGRLETGMPVISDPYEAARPEHVAVIVGFSGVGAVKLRFLSTRGDLTSSVFASDPDDITPLEAFGVAIELKDGLYRCVQVPGAPHTAVFRNGDARPWRQDLSDREWWPYRPEVLAVLDPAYLIENI